MKQNLKRLKVFFVKYPQIWVFGLLILFRFWPMFFQAKTLVFGDNYSLMVPGKIFTADWLKQGILPLWNPYLLSGMPWVSDINQSVLYFSSFLFVVFKASTALNLAIILHLLISYWGMYLLVKTRIKQKYLIILAAVLWTFSTQVSGSINNLSTIQSIVWLPWIVLIGTKIRVNLLSKLLFAVLITLQFLGGYPQHVIYSILATVLFSIYAYKGKFKFWIWFKDWFITALVTFFVSAIAWLPFAQMLLTSTRMIQSGEQALVGSLSPIMLAKLFLPYAFDKATAGIKWGPVWSGQTNLLFYLSWLPLLILVVSLFDKKLRKKFKFYWIYTLISLIFSMGKYLPGFTLVQKLIPLFKVGRYPSMILFTTTLILVLWVAEVFESIKLKKKVLSIFSKLSIFILGMSLILLIVANFGFSSTWTNLDNLIGHKLSSSQFHTLERDQLILQMISQNLVIAAALFSLSVLAYQANKKCLLVLIISFDLIYATQAMFFFAPNKIYDYSNPVIKELSKQTNLDFKQYRLLTRNSNKPYTDYGIYWESMLIRHPFSDSFISEQELKEYQVLQQIRDGLTPDWNAVWQTPTIHGYTTLLPQDYASIWQTSDTARINFVDFIELDHPQLKNWSAGYYLVDSWFEVKEDLSQLEQIGQYDKWTLYKLPALSKYRYENDQQVEIINFEENPNQIKLTFNNQDAYKFLINAERYDPGWQVWLNGQPVEIENHDGMRKIPIQDGYNQLLIKYQPRAFYYAAGISLLAVIVFALLSKKELSSLNLKR